MTEVPAADAALLAEAAAKSGLVWLRPPGGGRPWPAWHVWHEGAVLVVSGAGEQQLPDLRGPVELMVRSKDSGARLITVAATAEVVDPDDEGWAAAAAALAASRLNSATAPADLPARWRAEGAVLTRVRAHGAALEAPGRYDDASGAAPPPPTPATTSHWRPWHLRGRRLRAARRRRRTG